MLQGDGDSGISADEVDANIREVAERYIKELSLDEHKKVLAVKDSILPDPDIGRTVATEQ